MSIIWTCIQIVIGLFVILWAIAALIVAWEKTKPRLPEPPESEPRLTVINPDGSKQELQLLYSGKNIDELV